MYNLKQYFSLKSKFILKILLSTVILFSIIQQNIFAEAKTWNGSVSTDWATAANWTNSGVPGAGDDVTIPTSPTGGRMPIIISGTFSTDNLTIQSGATLTQKGGQLSTADGTSISGTFDQQGGTFLTNDNVTVTSSGQINQSSSGVIHLASSLSTIPNKKLTIDRGTVNSAGTIIVRDLEMKNGGTFNQSAGELVVQKDFKCPVGCTFASTGGTVGFAGAAGPGADYAGDIQFHNVIVDAIGNYNMNKAADKIKISGNFTNNNPNLDNTLGTVTFNGTGNQTIFSSSTPLPRRTTFGSLLIDKPFGSISLLSNIAVENNFTQTSGNLDLNGYIIYVAGNPLPVELSSFSAILLENSVKLVWRTETEVSNYGFEVERLQDYNIEKLQDWKKIGFVAGHGNSNSPKHYSFMDESVSGGKYSYRLKQIDTDGVFEYSKVIEIDLGSPAKFELSQNYPNPFNPATTIRFALSESGNIKLTVYNLVGEQVAILVDQFKEKGVHTINFNASELTSGIYVYKIETGVFTQSRKMILVK